MTSDPEMIGLLQVWLDDVQPLPHSAIDRALAQVPRVVQRRHVWALDRHGGSRLVTAAVLLGVAIALTVGALLRVPTGTQVGGGPAGFVPTGSMLQAREMVTATTLQDGRVLAVGGWEYQDQATVELWDPKTGTFSVAGNMPEPREGQSATLLPSGRVLVVGGYKYKVDRLATALLWDPDTLTFSPAGSLAVPRVGHAAVLLPDGRVLIAGGGLPTAEIWDPVAQAFSDAGASIMPGQRVAKLRPDGRVLIVDDRPTDQYGDSHVVSAELWDPWTLSFSPLGTLARPQGWDSATPLPDGRVLVVGGCCSFGPPDGSAVLWEPDTSTVVPAGSLLETRWNATATLLPDGRVLIVGGDGGEPGDHEVALATAEVWDPRTLSFSPAGSLSQGAEIVATAVLADGSVLAIGGSGPGGSGSAEIWRP